MLLCQPTTLEIVKLSIFWIYFWSFVFTILNVSAVFAVYSLRLSITRLYISIWKNVWVILTIKPTRCTYFWNLFWNETLHVSDSSSVHHQELFTLHTATAFPSWSCCCSKAVYKPVWHIPLLCVQWITPDDGQRNCLKHVEFHFQNKFEKLVHLVGFIISICHDARSHVTMHGHTSRYTVTYHDARLHITMHGHISRCTVTCHDTRSHVTMQGHMNVKKYLINFNTKWK
jgi:hypothetical protein